jgi:hydrogenase maturation factor
MCFVSPAQVVARENGLTIVERSGERFPVTTIFLDEEPAIGAWVSVQAQHHALAILTEDDARTLFALYDQILATTAEAAP